jgi:hypothetical protein
MKFAPITLELAYSLILLRPQAVVNPREYEAHLNYLGTFYSLPLAKLGEVQWFNRVLVTGIGFCKFHQLFLLELLEVLVAIRTGIV